MPGAIFVRNGYTGTQRQPQKELVLSTYFCRWPNGDVSLVTGKSRLDVYRVLDEVGNAEGAELIRLGDAVAVHFRLDVEAADRNDDYLELERFDEGSTSILAEKVYPLLTEAFNGMFDENDEYHHNQELYKAALKAEATRVKNKSEKSSDSDIAAVQALTDMPKSLIEELKKLKKRAKQA